MKENEDTVSENVGRQTTQGVHQGGVETGTIRETDISEGERATMENLDHSGLLFANAKRTFDEFQQESLETIRQNRTHFNNMQEDSRRLLNQISENAIAVAQKVSEQCAETANMVAKQAVRHSDIAIDRQWNVDEQAFVVKEILNDPDFTDAIKVALVGKVNDAASAARARK